MNYDLPQESNNGSPEKYFTSQSVQEFGEINDDLNVQEFVQQLKAMDQFQKISTNSVKDLNEQLRMSKLFLNMVIHDLRNPTSSIKMGLQDTIFKIIDIKEIFKDQEKFCEITNKFNQKISENIKQFNKLSYQSLQNQNFLDGPLDGDQTSSLRSTQLRIKHLHNCVRDMKEQQNIQFNQIETIFDSISEQQLKVFEQYHYKPKIYRDLVEEYIDFEQDMIDEDAGEDFVSNRVNMSSKEIAPKSSLLLVEKRKILRKDLDNLIKQNKLILTNSQFDQLIEQLLMNSLTEKKEFNAQGTQTDEDQEAQSFLSIIESTQEQLESVKQILSDQNHQIESIYLEINSEVQLLGTQISQVYWFKEMLLTNSEIQENYYKQSYKVINEKAIKAQKVLQNQIFSQSMMENLINDLLDLAKLENNSFTFSKDYFDLGISIYEAFQILISSANQNGIELVASIDTLDNLELIQSIYGDQRRYKQIFLNFISNSLKFTNKKGKITVAVKILNQQVCDKMTKKNLLEQSKEMLLEKIQQTSSLEVDDSQSVMDIIKQDWIQNQRGRKNTLGVNEGQERYINIQISVIDTGVGMSEEGVKKLFIDFNKLDENSQRNKQGTGLGLSICKKIIEQMGGSVSVKSKVGEGSEFIINVKTKCIVKKCELVNDQNINPDEPFVFIQKGCNAEDLEYFIKNFNKQEQDDLKKVEDRAFIKQMEKLKVQRQKMDKQMVMQNAYQVPQILKDKGVFGVRQAFSLSDLQQEDGGNNMLNMHGQSINHEDSSNSQKLIIHLSQERKIESKSQVMFDVIPEDLERDSQNLSITAKRKYRCLVANDDQCQLYMMDIILKLANFEVVTAQNGFEAFEMVAAAMKFQQMNIQQIVKNWKNPNYMSQVKMFDLVILDLNMPISDGYEACKKINQMYDENKLFKKLQKVNNGTESNCSVNGYDNLVKDLKPLIIACSSDDVDNPIMRQTLIQCGFDEVTGTPLTAPYVKGTLTEMIENNIEELEQKFKCHLQIEAAQSNENEYSEKRRGSVDKKNRIRKSSPSSKVIEQVQQFISQLKVIQSQGPGKLVIKRTQSQQAADIMEDHKNNIDMVMPQLSKVASVQPYGLLHNQFGSSVKNESELIRSDDVNKSAWNEVSVSYEEEKCFQIGSPNNRKAARKKDSLIMRNEIDQFVSKSHSSNSDKELEVQKENIVEKISKGEKIISRGRNSSSEKNISFSQMGKMNKQVIALNQLSRVQENDQEDYSEFSQINQEQNSENKWLQLSNKESVNMQSDYSNQS